MDIVEILKLFSNILIAIGIVYAAKNYSLSKKDRERKIKLETIEYISKVKQNLIDAEDIIHSNLSFWTEKTENELLGKLEQDDELRASVNKVFNSLNTLAKNVDVFDDEIVIEYFRSHILLWYYSKFYIDKVRKIKTAAWKGVDTFMTSITNLSIDDYTGRIVIQGDEWQFN